MKHFKKEIIPEKTITTESHRTCDLCGTKSKKSGWDCGHYEINDATVKCEVSQEEGSSSPDGGSKTYYDIDICPMCFKSELVPWLRSKGANIEEQESDW